MSNRLYSAEKKKKEKNTDNDRQWKNWYCDTCVIVAHARILNGIFKAFRTKQPHNSILLNHRNFSLNIYVDSDCEKQNVLHGNILPVYTPSSNVN